MNDEMTQRMLSTISSSIEKLDGKITKIEDSMAKILVIEEKQVSAKEELIRLNAKYDQLQVDRDTDNAVLHKRINDQEKVITELRLALRGVVVKVSIFATVAGAVVASLVAFVVPKMLGG